MALAVYGLIDPTTNELRYVGKSVDPFLRLRDHMSPSHLRANRYCPNWLRGLRNRGLRPELVIIEETSSDSEAYAAEAFWMAYYRAIGCRLTNLQDHGPGGRKPGWHHTEATKAKIRAARAVQPHPMLGIPKTEETKAKLRAKALLRSFSPEHRSAISRALTGKHWSTETRASRLEAAMRRKVGK